MAPSPENDNAPKAPDKGEKCKETHAETRLTELENTTAGPENKEASVSRLDDGQLKALLDEAITYKSPKDRVGKSQLFQNLLAKAEEDDRKARATSASGSELVRHYNRSATRRNRHCKEPSSVAENLTHGGSLNNLAKEELYQANINHLHRLPKTVSARQRQGGSLPCNVNAGLVPTSEFFEEARKIKESQQMEYTTIDMESESLLEHDSLNQDYTEQEMEVQPKFSRQYTSRATIEITPKSSCGQNTSSNVDDAVMVSALERCEKPVEVETYKPMEPLISTTAMYPTNCAFLNVPTTNWNYKKPMEEKKVDENGNALGQGSTDSKKNKKKKAQTDKNVRVIEGKDVEGHRSDIIHDLDKLMEYIGGSNKSSSTSGKSKGNVHKTKLNKQHASSEEKSSTTKKQRSRTKNKGENLQKSSSMEEISSTKLEDFDFVQESDGTKVPLRNTKSNAERPRERRSWGNSETTTEFEQIQNLQIYPNASAENLETADFHVVTKKKKSKKRRNSLNGRRQPFSRDSAEDDFSRRLSPEPRKSACSVPQSEKSNDSSDEDRDSVRSLPVTSDRMNVEDGDSGLNFPISYADIARNSSGQDRPRWNRPPSERKNVLQEKTQSQKTTNVSTAAVFEPSGNDGTEEVVNVKNDSPDKMKKQFVSVGHTPPKNGGGNQVVAVPEKNRQQNVPNSKNNNPPPDVNSLQNWPTITNNNNNSKTGANNLLQNDKVLSRTNNNYNNPNMVQKQRNFTNVKNMKNNTFAMGGGKQDRMQQMHTGNNTNNNNNLNIRNALNTEAMQMIRNSSESMNNASNLPHNIPDVQTIEKMHFKQLQQNVYQQSTVPSSSQEIIYNHTPQTHQNLQSPPHMGIQSPRAQEQNPHHPPNVQMHPKNALSPPNSQLPLHNPPPNMHHHTKAHPHQNLQQQQQPPPPQKFYPMPQNLQVHSPPQQQQHFHPVHPRNLPDVVQILPQNVQMGAMTTQTVQTIPVTAASQNIHGIHQGSQGVRHLAQPLQNMQSPPQQQQILTPLQSVVPSSQNAILYPTGHHQGSIHYLPPSSGEQVMPQVAQSPPQSVKSCGSEGSRSSGGKRSNISGGGGGIATSMDSVNENCDSARTNARPAVVILSGEAKEVSGLTFGFEINEQLLSDDVCESFTARFVVPDGFKNHNHDKIVNFIGLAWDEVANQIDGKVKYYSDQL